MPHDNDARGPGSHAWMDNGPGFVEKLDKMVRAGRLTEEDAERLRSAAKAGTTEDAVREIQLKHAKGRVSAALEDGRVTQEVANELFDRLDSGEDPRFLRGRLR